ncbi:hypothetical protein SAMN05443144_109121 [Fodinibius roseus]|uniref:Uncharacterized protein n=1 Tax=Fodinibius roseus TaxID=1194090 RepID=A0A1M5C6Q8_9BACT|nr:hypothetical protein SAMN05443144_109121 [Fodinibius roseus]
MLIGGRFYILWDNVQENVYILSQKFVKII